MLYADLEQITEKPPPFSVSTTCELWTDEHTSAQMLRFHLDGAVDLASRRTSFIDESVGWMAQRFGLGPSKRVIDFGCGPGLYTSRFAAMGANVTGVDFSSRSLTYARERAAHAGHAIRYDEADYLTYEPDGRFDLITMIMCDFSALSPDQRAALLDTFRSCLAEDGRIVFDVHSLADFERKQSGLHFAQNLQNGFWSSQPYFGFLAKFKYETEKVSLDKYVIVEPHRRREIYNWLQYFSVDALERELAEAGLEVESVLGDVAGNDFDSGASEFAVVAKRAS